MTGRDATFADARVLPADVIVEQAADGTIRARSPHPLGPYAARITDRLEHWAVTAPGRAFLAERDASGAWRVLSYAEALGRVRHLAQALLDRGLSADRAVVILSRNSIEHALVGLAAMYCGVPYAPVAPAYSLAVREFDTLHAIVETMRPALVFADAGEQFERALGSVAARGLEIVTSTPASRLRTTALAELEAAGVTSRVDAAHAGVGPSTVAKVLFTSGSTGRPKGVINTQRMLCANQEQVRAVMRLLGDAPPVLCDWLPWNHTFGGNHNFGIVLYNGGTLYIDHGRPVPDLMPTTIANLRDVATTAYFNVPRGFEMLLPVLDADAGFREHFFSRLGLLFYAAAGLRPEVADRMQALAIQTRGAPIPWVTGLGATETAPFALCTGAMISTTTHVGVPAPGLELKATPVGGLLEARVAGPNVMPGYWRDETLTRDAFDEDGFYKTGDVIAPTDPDDLSKGFEFQGRLTEDFKLGTGTWVRVGTLRSRLLAALRDVVQDVVITAPNRDSLGALLFPNIAACRALAGAAADGLAVADLLAHARVRRRIVEGLAGFNRLHGSSSTAIERAMLMDVPPSIDAMEITDKGSINQKAVLAHRSALVDALYAATGQELLV